MEEKESTISVSAGGNSDSYTDSPPPVSSNLMLPQPPPPPHMMMNIDASAPPTAPTIASTGGSVDLFGKKKRGRPSKYDGDGNLRLPSYYTVPVVSPPPPGFSFSPSSPDFSSSKRSRGRPPGSGNWQLLASLGELFANTAGGDFTPHVVTVNTGEDVADKIRSFSQKGPRGICVLSANGAISNVTIRQPGSSGGILTYEGRFEIVSLSGSYTVTDNGGARSRTGGLSVSLAGPDGRVIGGGIAGLLLAAGPIQLVVGSFMPNGYQAHKRKHHREHNHKLPSISPTASDTVTAARPISEAKPDAEIFVAPITPVSVQSHGQADNTANHKQEPNALSSHSSGWNDSLSTSNHRRSPDINLSLPE